jgi:tetratricopeptide (TPR) repeat protein
VRFSFYKWLTVVFIVLSFFSLTAQEIAVDSIPEHEKLYQNARVLVDSTKYKEALLLIKKITKMSPNYWEAHNLSAICKIKLNDYKNAEKDLEKANKIAPDNFETVKWKGINFYLQNNFNEAKLFLDTAMYFAVEDKLDDAELLYYRALLMFKGKSYKAALETCENALDIKPTYMEIFLLKGEIRFARKEYRYAIRELTQAVRLMPEGKPEYLAYKLRAKSNFEIGDFKNAVLDWDAYIDGNQKEEEALISRAAAKINTNDNSGAIVDLDEAIKINSKNAVSFCYRGVAKGGNKQYVEALKDLDYAIKLKFNYATAYVNRAAIKMASKDKRGACEDLQKADSLGSETAIQLIEKYCKNTAG